MHYRDEELINAYTNKTLSFIKDNEDLFKVVQPIMLDAELYLHSLDVAKLATQIAIAAGYDEEAIREVNLAGFLHDVGKTGIDQSILYKAGKLTEEEFEIIKQHSQLGYKMLEKAGVSENIRLMVLHHHRTKEGGYPKLDTELRPQDEVITTADIFSALCERRVYHQALSVLNTLEYISTFSNINRALLFRLPSLVRD